MDEITDYKDCRETLPEYVRSLLDGANQGKALDGKGIADDVRLLQSAKVRMKGVLGIEGFADGTALYHAAADEIERLRSQVEQLTADAVIRANRQAILIDALKRIELTTTNSHTMRLAAAALNAIGEAQP